MHVTSDDKVTAIIVIKMETDYKAMLDRAYKNLPEVLEEEDRFQIPRARVTRQGRRSIIMNFREIAEQLQRPPEHLLKFLLRETATRGNFDGDKVVFQGRFNADSIRNLVEIYTNKYVICPVCGIVEMSDIIAFHLWFGASILHDLKDAFLVIEGVFEDVIF